MRTEPALKADCTRCAALCCLMLAIDKGPKFGFDKAAGTPCPHLGRHACQIHKDLDQKGFSGCIQYDCLGAGQIVVQQIFAGESWQDRPELAAPMSEAFALLRRVQELRQSLKAAQNLCSDPDVRQLCDQLETALTPDWTAQRLKSFDLAATEADYTRLLAVLRTRLTPRDVAQKTVFPGPKGRQ